MKTFIAVITALLLIGCATPEVKIEYRYKTTLVKPSDQLLEDCDRPTPPDIAEYLSKKEWKDKEEILTDQLREFNNQMNKCNADKKSLRDWKEKQIKLLETEATTDK